MKRAIVLIIALLISGQAWATRYIFEGTYRDGNGHVVGGATVQPYLSSTTTAVNIYTTLTGTTPVSTVTTDATTGTFSFYVDDFEYDSDQTYDIALSKANYDQVTYKGQIPKPVLGNYTISTAKTVATDYKHRSGVVYVKAGSGSINFTGSFECGTYQAFSGFTTGVTFAPGAVDKVYAEWWGAAGNGITDDAAALNAAWTAAGTARGTLELLGKTYRFDSQLVWNNAPARVHGPGNEYCVLLKHGNFTGILMIGAYLNEYSDFSVKGDAGNGGIGVEYYYTPS
jgi:hypothetical protein